MASLKFLCLTTSIYMYTVCKLNVESPDTLNPYQAAPCVSGVNVSSMNVSSMNVVRDCCNLKPIKTAPSIYVCLLDGCISGLPRLRYIHTCSREAVPTENGHLGTIPASRGYATDPHRYRHLALSSILHCVRCTQQQQCWTRGNRAYAYCWSEVPGAERHAHG